MILPSLGWVGDRENDQNKSAPKGAFCHLHGASFIVDSAYPNA